jgi:hypothetical protein
VLKNVGIPEYYLGGNVEFLGEAWKNQGLGLALPAKTYIQNFIPRLEGLFGKEFKAIKTPMSKGYHPGVDDSPLCTDDDSAKYRSIIGYCIWIIFSGRFNIAYATSAMSSLNMLPREGHLKLIKHFQRGGSSLMPHTLTIPCTLLRTIQIGRNSIKILEEKFQRIFCLKKGQGSG